jgi:hypothetical protein
MMPVDDGSTRSAEPARRMHISRKGELLCDPQPGRCRAVAGPVPVPGQCRASAGAAPGQRRGSAGAAPGQRRGSAGAAPGQRRGSARAAPGQRRASAGAAPGQRRGSAGAAPGQRRGSAGPAPGQRRASAGAGPVRICWCDSSMRGRDRRCWSSGRSTKVQCVGNGCADRFSGSLAARRTHVRNFVVDHEDLQLRSVARAIRQSVPAERA